MLEPVQYALIIDQDHRPITIENPDLVAVVKVDDYEPEHVQQGLERLLELLKPSFMQESLDSKTVFLKVNGLAPKALACTSPVVVEELGKLLQANGCKNILVGDSNFTKAITNVTLKSVGISTVAERLGNPIVNFFEHGWIPIAHDSFQAEKVITIPESIAKADIIINMPRLKTHSGVVFTGAIKNFYGLQSNKMRMHAMHKDKVSFQRLLGDMHQAVLASASGEETKKVLHIMDGIIGMDGKGPSAGNPVPFKVLIGSFSPVALDVVAYSLMGGNPADLEAIQSLGTRNGWPVSIDNLRIVGDDWKPLVQNAKLPSLNILKGGQQGEKGTSGFTLWATRVSIHLNQKKCKKCLTCVNLCPVGALSKQGDKIAVDTSKCINCFCCGECCPNDALVTRSNYRVLFNSVVIVAVVAAIGILTLLFLLHVI